MGLCKFDGGTFIWLNLARLWPGLAQPGQARLGRRRRPGRSDRGRRGKNELFIEKRCFRSIFDHFRTFLTSKMDPARNFGSKNGRNMSEFIN